MMGEIVGTRKQEIMIPMPVEKNPAAVYLARLGSEHSRCGMRWCLNIAACILTNGRYELHEIDWTGLRCHHIAALKARLMQPNRTVEEKEAIRILDGQHDPVSGAGRDDGGLEARPHRGRRGRADQPARLPADVHHESAPERERSGDDRQTGRAQERACDCQV